MKIVPALGIGWLTPLYDIVISATLREKAFRRALIDAADIRSGHDALDLACGTGTLAAMIATRAGEVRLRGLDADPQILAIAERKSISAGARVQFDHGFSNRLPYPDGSFDRVVSSLFFHHLSMLEKRETAREVLRVLRPGGELHVADWGRASNWLMRALFVPVQFLDGFANTRDNVSGGLPAVFADAGFVNVRQTRTFATMFGSLALYRATKPGATAGALPVS